MPTCKKCGKSNYKIVGGPLWLTHKEDIPGGTIGYDFKCLECGCLYPLNKYYAYKQL